MDPSDRLRELVAINRAIISSLDYDEVLSLIVEKTAMFAEADACVLLLTRVPAERVDSSQATVAAAVGVALEKVRDFSAPLDERIGGALRELLDFQPADRFMGVPVVLRGRIAGILAVYWRGPEPPPPEDEFLLSALSDQAAIALEHATRYRRIREDLATGKAVYQAVGEAIPFGTWISDPDGGMTYLSDSFLQLLGMTLEEAAGFGWTRRLPPEDRELVCADWMRCVERGDFWDYEYRVLGADGQYHALLSRGVPVHGPSGNTVCWAGLNLDLSERKRLEDELRERAHQLGEADRQKDQFLAMLAHELRNPLGTISNGLQLLRRRALSDPAIQRALSVLERQVQHQSRIVDDLLDVSRITRGKINLEPEWLDLGWLIRHTAEDHRAALEAAGLVLVLELPPEPVWVVADRTRIAQVLGNLVTNAAKFTDAGGQITISLTMDRDRSEAAVTVRDTGIGIAPEMLASIFESFVQVDQSLDRSRGGVGLGLALVKGLVNLHRGRVYAESPGLGHGAAFTFALPLAAKDSGLGKEGVPERPPVGPRRILVIEDNRDAAEILRDVLELSGHEVAIALSGPTGVDAARQLQPEVILCDIGLPGFDGYQVARTLRQDPVTAAVQLIALSGYGQEEDRRHSQEAGFDRHLVKPVNFHELEGLLATAPPKG